MESNSSNADFDLSPISTSESHKYLFIHGIVFQLVLDCNSPQGRKCDFYMFEHYDMFMANVNCLVMIVSTDPLIEEAALRNPETSLLVARNQINNWMYLHLLVLRQEGGYLATQERDHPTDPEGQTSRPESPGNKERESHTWMKSNRPGLSIQSFIMMCLPVGLSLPVRLYHIESFSAGEL
ncbi:hypothetical protein GJ744_002122 [Endocarpon pusillum]|uniref:Uncharacterized protein n=1 Tax=Endocarpon pusillum TaxID=364733 RepID=A0A8H7ACA1_9EURO|nr:hypothetical protein GJ744_002122 [Endocarpon pusillum]